MDRLRVLCRAGVPSGFNFGAQHLLGPSQNPARREQPHNMPLQSDRLGFLSIDLWQHSSVCGGSAAVAERRRPLNADPLDGRWRWRGERGAVSAETLHTRRPVS